MSTSTTVAATLDLTTSIPLVSILLLSASANLFPFVHYLRLTLERGSFSYITVFHLSGHVLSFILAILGSVVVIMSASTPYPVFAVQYAFYFLYSLVACNYYISILNTISTVHSFWNAKRVQIASIALTLTLLIFGGGCLGFAALHLENGETLPSSSDATVHVLYIWFLMSTILPFIVIIISLYVSWVCQKILLGLMQDTGRIRNSEIIRARRLFLGFAILHLAIFLIYLSDGLPGAVPYHQYIQSLAQGMSGLVITIFSFIFFSISTLFRESGNRTGAGVSTTASAVTSNRGNGGGNAMKDDDIV